MQYLHVYIFWMQGLHLGKRSMVSITTSTCCEVIHIKEEWIQSTVDEVLLTFFLNN